MERERLSLVAIRCPVLGQMGEYVSTQTLVGTGERGMERERLVAIRCPVLCRCCS